MRAWFALLTACSTAGWPHSTLETSNGKPIHVELHTPASIGQACECTASGTVSAELFAPIAAFVERRIVKRSLAWASLDTTRDSLIDPFYEAPAPAISLDPHSERGVLRINDGHLTDFYCVVVKEYRTEVRVTLDHYVSIVACGS